MDHIIGRTIISHAIQYIHKTLPLTSNNKKSHSTQGNLSFRVNNKCLFLYCAPGSMISIWSFPIIWSPMDTPPPPPMQISVCICKCLIRNDLNWIPAVNGFIPNTQAPIGLVNTIRMMSVGYELNSEFSTIFSTNFQQNALDDPVLVRVTPNEWRTSRSDNYVTRTLINVVVAPTVLNYG